MSGYFNNGVNFDDLFEARTTSKRTDVGYSINGSDISNRYEKASSGTPASNVGYRVNGNDIGPMFAAKGGVTYWDGTLDDVLGQTDTRLSGTAQAETILYGDGVTATRTFTNETTNGRWDGAVANSSNTQVRFVVSNLTGAGFISNSAPNWSSIGSVRAVSLEIADNGGRSSCTVTVGLREAGDASTEIFKEVQLQASSGL